MLNLARSALLLLLLAGTAGAQIRTGPFRAGGFASRPNLFIRSRRAFYPGYGAYAFPYFYSDFYQPYQIDYAPAEPPPAPEPVVPAKTEPVADAVMFELHGNQWVKVTNFSEASARVPSLPAEPAKPLPPAILVFRDGHTEETSSYSIIGNSIYVKGDYWTTGAWTRTVPISDLNLAVTVRENQLRGVKFEVPSSPDEIMIRF
jgi:hypothetical protein